MEKNIVCLFAFGFCLLSLTLAQDFTSWEAGGITSEQFPATLVGVESPIAPEKYALMPGDRLLVTVGGKLSYSYQTLVTYEGKLTVNMPLSSAIPSYESERTAMLFDVVDAVPVSELTLAEAEGKMTEAFRRYFKDAVVKLTLIGLHRAVVFVTGEVLKPGGYNALPIERVSQVIARAGGITPLGSRSKISLIRDGAVSAVVNIERFEREGDLNANPFVKSGDVIYVPPAQGMVTVRGAIYSQYQYENQQGSNLRQEKEGIKGEVYELNPGERVFDIIKKTRGLTPWADLHNCYIERLILGGSGRRQRILVDLHRVLFEGDSTDNVEMHNGDILVIPATSTLVYVQGEVQEPGSFPYLPNMRVSDCIGQAGGPTENGNLRGVQIIRNGRRLSGRNNPLVEPGDVVLVPRYGLKWWQDYVTILSAIGIPTVSLLIALLR